LRPRISPDDAWRPGGPSRGAGAALLLSDGRLPGGGYAHSGGLEEAVASSAVTDLDSLAAWLKGRLFSVGRMEAAFAAYSWGVADGRPQGWEGGLLELEAELGARMASPASRKASRALGRGLVRTARRAWPHPLVELLWQRAPDGHGPYHPLALGAVAWAAGLGAAEVALVASLAAIQGPAWSATKLLACDPVDLNAILASMVPMAEQVGASALPLPAEASRMPSASAWLLEMGAQRHAEWEVRLFVS